VSVVLAVVVIGLLVLAVAVVAGTEMRHRYDEKRRRRAVAERRLRASLEADVRSRIRRVPR